MAVGDIFRIRRWRHESTAKGEWMEFAHPNKNMVGVFVFLGFERRDGTGPTIDPQVAMRSIGYVPEKEPE